MSSRRKGIDDQSANMNDEWKCMFGGLDTSSKHMHSSRNQYDCIFTLFFSCRIPRIILV